MTTNAGVYSSQPTRVEHVSAGLWARQPIKGIFLALKALRVTIIDLPVCAVYYAFYRPRPTWSWKDSMGCYTINQLMQAVGDYRIPLGSRHPQKTVSEKSLKESSVISVPGVPESMLKGTAVSDDAKPLPHVTGYVWPKGADVSSAKGKVALYMHGGGYYMFSGHESDPVASNVPRQLMKHTCIQTVLVTEFRDANYGIWPASLIDALAGYHHLVVNCGIRPEDIVLVGDSASAHLQNCLIRYLRDEKVLPMPSKVVLLSPWTYQSLSKPHRHLDFLNYEYIAFGAGGLGRGNFPLEYSSPCHPALAPSKELFEYWPPVYLHFGEVEVLAEDAWELERRLRLAGVDVTLVCETDAVHDMLVCTWFSTPERHAAAWKKISKWIES